MRMIFRCEWIKVSAGCRPKTDDKGFYLRNDKGQYLYEKCERFSVRLAPVGFPTRVGAVTDQTVHENAKIWTDSHGVTGQIQMDNIDAKAAAQFKVGREYYIEPICAEVDSPAPQPPPREPGKEGGL